MTGPKLSIWYANVLVVATCGLVYELLAGTLASYLMGDSVTQFSVIIGLYIFALGVGAYLSGHTGGATLAAGGHEGPLAQGGASLAHL